MTIELDPDSDICRINGEYVFYGAYDEPDYIRSYGIIWELTPGRMSYMRSIPMLINLLYHKFSKTPPLIIGGGVIVMLFTKEYLR